MQPDKETILQHFGGDFGSFYSRYLHGLQKDSKTELKCLCPFHDEKDPSFKCNRETGAWYCHAEKVGGDMFSFYARKHGLDVKADFQKVLAGIARDFGINGQPTRKKLGKIVATYDYPDENGKLLYQVVRYAPKTFRQRRPNGSGGWIWSLQDTRRVLYNLPAIKNAREIILCEGEKDCDRLNAVGLNATTNPQGAGKWHEDFTKTLTGKDVFLVPDNDEAGHKHAAEVADQLKGEAKSVKLIDLPIETPGADISDWFDTFGDDETAVERLSILIENTPEIQTSKFIWPLEDLSGWLTIEPPAQEWLYHGKVPKKIVAGINAQGGTGKTYFIEALITGTVIGKEVFRIFNPEKPLRVLACLGEDPPEITRARLHAIARHFVSDWLSIQDIEDAFRENLGLVSGVAGPLMELDPNGNPQPSQYFHEVKKRVEQINPQLIVIDPKAQFFGLAENENDHNTMWVNTLKTLTVDGAVVLFSHHVPKGSDAFNPESFRGGGALKDACRWTMGLKVMDEKTALEFGIEDPWYYVHCRITKASYSPPESGTDYYFRRGEGGALERVEPRISLYKTVASHISEVLEGHYSKGGPKLTQRSFLKTGEGKDLREQVKMEHQGVTAKVMKQAITYGIENKMLMEIAEREASRSGRVVKYLNPGGWLV